MRRGLLEFAVVVGLLALAAAGALVLEGDAIRAWLGLRPSRPAEARPSPAAAAGEAPPPARR